MATNDPHSLPTGRESSPAQTKDVKNGVGPAPRTKPMAVRIPVTRPMR